MTSKKGALTFPDNPLAAMRGLEELDTALPVADTTGSAVGNTTSSKESRAVAQTDTLPVADTTGSAVGNTTESDAGPKTAGGRPRPAPPAAAALPEDPMQTALLAMLARPYDTQGRVPTTVTSIKVPTDLWERLGWVAQISGRSKQDIIAEALRQHFETVRRDMTKGR